MKLVFVKEKDADLFYLSSALEKSDRANVRNVRVSVAIRYVPIAELGQSKDIVVSNCNPQATCPR